ncbi:MAG: helix-turn-helix domain-containing protein, partial [Planctomycetota bacterium]
GRAETKFNIILTKDEVDDLQIYEESREAEVKAQIREIAEGRRVRTEAQAGQADTETWEKKETIALKLVIDGSMAYWDNTLLPTIKGKRFDILLKLAGKPKDIVVHQDLSELIESDSEKNREAILRQYISGLRKAFPTPYNDRSHPQCIIKTKRMEGYYLNLSPDLVEIV